MRIKVSRSATFRAAYCRPWGFPTLQKNFLFRSVRKNRISLAEGKFHCVRGSPKQLVALGVRDSDFTRRSRISLRRKPLFPSRRSKIEGARGGVTVPGTVQIKIIIQARHGEIFSRKHVLYFYLYENISALPGGKARRRRTARKNFIFFQKMQPKRIFYA